MRIRDDASSGQFARFMPRLMMDFIGAGLTCVAGTLANVAFDGGPPAGRWSLVGVKLLVAYAAACVVVLVLFPIVRPALARWLDMLVNRLSLPPPHHDAERR